MTVYEPVTDEVSDCEKYYDQTSFDKHFGNGALQPPTKRTPKKAMRKTSVSAILSFFPILNWLPKYSIKDNLFNDVIGGLTVGIMHVPQGMAYASLASVRPVNGLYTSLFPALIYMVFGTSRHVSLGVFAVVSLMVGTCNLRVTKEILDARNDSLIDNLTTDDAHAGISMEVVTSLTLMVGLIQLVLAICRLDFLTAFLSDQIIAGFTTGAALHVFVAQLNKILGVPLPRSNGFMKMYFNLQELVRSITTGHVNPMTLGLSVVTIAGLFALKELLDPIIKKKCKLPVPYELFVMIFGTIISTVFNLHAKFNVKVIGEIPTGLPAPSFPDPRLFSYFWSDAIGIAVVSLVVTVSMGKLFAKKHNYEIDVRQEFYAVGFMESISSLFPVWPSSTALARTLVYEAAGTKTQLATIFSSILLLATILFLGPYVEELPVCFLSCIIIVALKGMFMQLKQIPILWSASRFDCAIFVVTMFATIAFDVVEGLAAGIIFSLAVIIYRMQSAHLVEFGQLTDGNGKEYFRSLEGYSESARIDGIAVVQFPAPLVFLNIEQFRKELERIITEQQISTVQPENGSTVIYKEAEVRMKIDGLVKHLRAVIIDLAAVNYIDYSGMRCFMEVVAEWKKAASVEIKFANSSSMVLRTLSTSPDFQSSGLVSHFYPSVEDAFNSVQK